MAKTVKQGDLTGKAWSAVVLPTQLVTKPDMPGGLMAERRLSWDEMLRVPEERLNDYSHAPVRLLPGADAFFRYLAPYTFSSVIMGRRELVMWGSGRSQLALPIFKNREFSQI